MSFFAKESLETLKGRIDLVEVVGGYVELRRAGAVYKGLCPFHDEKTPSFSIQRGQAHYHCFGCGAHGDAIGFLMQYAKLSFVDAVESLAQRFNVTLQRIEAAEEGKVDKRLLKNALEQVCRYYHTLLLYTTEGHNACRYLQERGIDMAFIRRFRLGYALPERGLLLKAMKKAGISRELLIEVGVLSQSNQGDYQREFFSDRILFPVCDSMGAIIGFSARKFKETTFGGKYVNTPETPLFKKSRILFGLDISRRRIAKERRAILVEGQLDALRLLSLGLDLVIATQGTAFAEGHLRELTSLGVKELWLAFDADGAGREAALKVGHLCQKQGVDVKIVRLPETLDPDSFVRQQGLKAFIKLLENSQNYLDFLIEQYSVHHDMSTPAGKNTVVQELTQQIRQWGEPVMIHESLRQLAHLLRLPEEMVVGSHALPAPLHLRQNAYAGAMQVDPDRVLESDFLRWLLLAGSQQADFAALAVANIQPQQLLVPLCCKVYEAFLHVVQRGETCDLLTLAIALEDAEGQAFVAELMQRKLHVEKAEELFTATLQKILDRNWMRQREALRVAIQSGTCSDAEVQDLLLQFDTLRRQPPQLVCT
jgi:DNA primase